MSASNLFDDLEGDDDIFYTPAKTPPKKKKQWMDDLLDDDKDLFGDIKVDEKETVAVVAAGKEKLEEETEAKKPKSGGGLFDDLPLDDGGDAPLSTNDGQASNSVNGYKDEEFVVVSHDEVPSREETERTANPPPDTDTTEAEHDGPNSDLFNQNIGYEERARLRREQRRKRAEEKEHSSKTPSPTSPPLDDTKQDRDKRSTTPSPSPGIEETTQVFSGSGKAQSPVADPGHVAVEPQVEKADSSTPTPEPPAQQSKDDSNEQIWQLTKSLERAQSENGYLKSENERLSGQVKTLQDKVAQLEKQLADRDKKEDVDNAANKKQVADLQEQLKSKDKEIEELRAVLKKSESPHHASITTVVSGKKTPHSPRTKLRAGVDKGRPITSVAESVKKFGGAGTAEVKRTPAPAKPKQSSPAHVKPDDKHTTAKKPSVPLHPKPSPPSKPRATVHHDKPDAHTSKHSHTHHPHPSAKDHTHHPHPHSHSHHTPHAHHPHPHKPEPANKSAKVTHKKPHPHHHAHSHTTTSDKKESEKQDKKMEEEKKTEVTITKEEPKPEPEPVAPPADAEPPSEPKPEAPAAEVKPSEKKEEETTIQQLEKDTTRAQRVISMFENKGTNKPEQEQAPSWKVNAQQQRTARDKEEREKEVAKQKEQEQEEKEKPEVEEKSRTSSNASSHKDEPVVVNGSVETTTAESANDEKEETDGGMITKPKAVAPASSNVTKNTSNKNEEIKIRDNKMKKTGSATTIIPDPKKRLMVDEAKGKRTSWAAPKREECAVCGKVVYVMERLEADKVVYHKTCFKCTVCNKTLSTGNYAALQGKTYCKVHFKQLFKMKGNYDEGFGREQHKTKWIKKDGENEA